MTIFIPVVVVHNLIPVTALEKKNTASQYILQIEVNLTQLFYCHVPSFQTLFIEHDIYVYVGWLPVAITKDHQRQATTKKKEKKLRFEWGSCFYDG